jgi:hypothetical protein
MKTIINNIQNGNTVTQRNLFLIISLAIIVMVGGLDHFGIISLTALNNR